MITKAYMIKTDSRISNPDNLNSYECTTHEMRVFTSLKKAQSVLRIHEKRYRELYYFPEITTENNLYSDENPVTFGPVLIPGTNLKASVQNKVYLANPTREFIYFDGLYWTREYIIEMQVD